MYIFSRSTWLRRFTQTTSNGWRCRPDSSCRGVLKIRRSTTESTTPRSSFVPSSSTRSSGPSREPSRTNISKSRILRGRQSLTTPKIGNLKSATTSTSTLINVAHLLLFMHFDQNVIDQSINQISKKDLETESLSPITCLNCVLFCQKKNFYNPVAFLHRRSSLDSQKRSQNRVFESHYMFELFSVTVTVPLVLPWQEDVLIFNLKYFILFNIFNGPFLTSLHWVIHSGLEKNRVLSHLSEPLL